MGVTSWHHFMAPRRARRPVTPNSSPAGGEGGRNTRKRHEATRLPGGHKAHGAQVDHRPLRFFNGEQDDALPAGGESNFADRLLAVRVPVAGRFDFPSEAAAG